MATYARMLFVGTPDRIQTYITVCVCAQLFSQATTCFCEICVSFRQCLGKFSTNVRRKAHRIPPPQLDTTSSQVARSFSSFNSFHYLIQSHLDDKNRRQERRHFEKVSNTSILSQLQFLRWENMYLRFLKRRPKGDIVRS